MRVAEIYRHSFLSDCLSSSSVVLDLGMNRGGFSHAISERFGCRIIGVEPVPHLFRALPSLPNVTAENIAVSRGGGSVTLYVNPDLDATILPALAHQGVDAVEVQATTVPDLMSRHSIANIDLAKFDIEGAELEILETIDSTTLRRIDQITVEFHDALEPSQAAAVSRVKNRLRREGFACVKFSRDNSDVLFINRDRIRFGARDLAWWVVRYKYPRGIARIRRRLTDRIRKRES